MKFTLPLSLILAAGPGLAQETRELGVHEHGVGELNIAFDGNTVAIELNAPGVDIVGFEYEAESAEDRAAIDEAVATLARPLDLFVLPAAAECSVTEASAELESEHAEHGEGHAEAHHEHDGEDDAEHAEAHDEDEAGHTEFQAEYVLTCADPGAITEMTFGYFEAFENALELKVRIVTSSGARAFEVERDEPVLDLRGMAGA